MAKMQIDKDLLDEIKDLNIVLRKGALTDMESAAEIFRKKNKKKKKIKPSRKRSKYDCGQCVVCIACTGTPTPDIEVAAVTGVVMIA